MPDRLSLRSTLLLVALAFGLAFAIQALLSGGSPTANPAANESRTGPSASAPAAEPDPSLAVAAKVPALRDARKHAARKQKPLRPQGRAGGAYGRPGASRAHRDHEPDADRRPAPSPPAPRPVVPKPVPTPKPTPAPTTVPMPAPTSTPSDSGEFDTNGEP